MLFIKNVFFSLANHAFAFSVLKNEYNILDPILYD